MLNVCVQLAPERMVLTAEGHAGYAPAGQDIVCAAASALINTLMLGLHALTGTGTHVEFEAADDGGPPVTIDCRASPRDRNAARQVYRVVACGLEALAYKYPDNVSFELTEY